MAEKSLIIDSNPSKTGIDVSKYYKHMVKTFLTSLGILFFGLLFFFLLIRIMPGNPYSLPEGNPIYEEEVSRLGLDKNPIIQFFIFLKNLLTGNWGNYSYNLVNNEYVIQYYEEIYINRMNLLPYHRFLELIFASIGISLIIGIFFGYLVSKHKKKKKGKIIRLLIILLWAIPVMGFGYIFRYIFSYRLRWFPGCSGASYQMLFVDSDYITYFPLIDCLLSGKCFWDRFLYLITPVSTLNLIMIPIITYFTYKLIEHFKSSKKIPNFTGKLGFFYSIIVNSTFFIGPLVCSWDLTFMFNDVYYLTIFNRFFLSVYLFLITFFIFNLVFNIIICGIALYLEQKEINTEKISMIEEKSVNKSKNSVIDENIDLKSSPKKNKIQRKQDVRIIIAAVIISLLFLITFLLLIKYFIIYLGIIVIIICIPLIFKKWRLILISKKEIESNHLNNNQKPSNEKESTITNNGFSKWATIIGSILIIISIFGIGIYGWDASGKNLFKTQTTLIIAILATLISIIGALFGFISAYYGKWVKKIIDYLILIFICIPGICILSVFIIIIEIANFRVIWIIGLISIPIVAHFTEEIISNEMNKNSIKPALFTAKNQNNQRNSFINIKHNLIFPIVGVLCLNVSFSILLYEGYNSLHRFVFLDPSFISLGRNIVMARFEVFSYSNPSSPFLLIIPAFWLFLIVCGFMLLGLGLYDYKRKKKIISKNE